jgi:phage terminase small subunit|tara:strand:+ start:82 stop:624 length:543 start_codon:yes stop_codon:yes gene_type:complete
MTKSFTQREQTFIDQMVNHCGKKTATQAAIDSGFGAKGARTRASELMGRDDIRNEIERKLDFVRQKWGITKDKHYQELGELRDMAKETKNVNAAVRAEELRGKVAGLYIDRQILANAKTIRLPDGTKKLEQDMTLEDYEWLMTEILERHKRLNEPETERIKKMKRVHANTNSRKKPGDPG